MARKCSRDASSGTTPPYFAWVLSCDATTEESTRSPSSTTAAAVSSHDDSMARMRINAACLLVQKFLDGARRLAQAMLVLHQREAHVAFAQGAESDARRNGDQRFFQKQFGKFERAGCAIPL